MEKIQLHKPQPIDIAVAIVGIAMIKKIKAPIGDENPNSPTFIKLKPIILRK